MRLSCSIPKVTNTHPEYVTLIAFTPEQWFAWTCLNVTLYVHCQPCNCWTLQG